MSVLDATVLVTPRSFGADDPSLREALAGAVQRVVWRGDRVDHDALGELVAGVDGWIAGAEPIDADVLRHADRLKIIARYGVGVDNVDLTCAASRGIVVTNTPGANAGAVAELTLGLMIALARGVLAADRDIRAGGWSVVPGVALERRVLGVLGLGAVGRAVASRAAALGMEVVAFDPVPPAENRPSDVRRASQAEVIATADFLSLHLPASARTRGMVDGAFLAAMKRGAFLINTARGDLLDELALADALRRGQLAGAALDVMAVEPPGAGFALASAPNLILTPHLGAQTDRARALMAQGAMESCLAALRGERPPNVIPPTRPDPAQVCA